MERVLLVKLTLGDNKKFTYWQQQKSLSTYINGSHEYHYLQLILSSTCVTGTAAKPGTKSEVAIQNYQADQAKILLFCKSLRL